jgi:NADPH:quinone reductase-like Zn-dependent oxidoreductase
VKTKVNKFKKFSLFSSFTILIDSTIIMFKVLTARLHPPKPSGLRLDGLTVLLVGASTGIGLEAAKKLATKGPAKLIVTARDASKASKTKALIEEHLTATSTPQSSIPTIVSLAWN